MLIFAILFWLFLIVIEVYLLKLLIREVIRTGKRIRDLRQAQKPQKVTSSTS